MASDTETVCPPKGQEAPGLLGKTSGGSRPLGGARPLPRAPCPLCTPDTCPQVPPRKPFRPRPPQAGLGPPDCNGLLSPAPSWSGSSWTSGSAPRRHPANICSTPVAGTRETWRPDQPPLTPQTSRGPTQGPQGAESRPLPACLCCRHSAQKTLDLVPPLIPAATHGGGHQEGPLHRWDLGGSSPATELPGPPAGLTQSSQLRNNLPPPFLPAGGRVTGPRCLWRPVSPAFLPSSNSQRCSLPGHPSRWTVIRAFSY